MLKLNWREEFVTDWKGDGVGPDCLKIVCVLLNKIVLSMSYYSLSSHIVTPSLLIIIALIRGNCLALLVSLLHRSSAPRYPICSSVADLANRFIRFFGEKIITIRHELDRSLCRELIDLVKSQLQQLDSIV